MQLRETIENMRKLASIHIGMQERIAMSDPTLYDIEAGVKYQEMADNEIQIAEWLEELETIKSHDIPVDMNLHNEEIINKTIGDCVDILSEYVDCSTCPIGCRGYIEDGCKNSLRVYLQEKLMGDEPIRTENLGFITYSCPHCGNKLYQFELFCDKCKKKLKWK